MAWRVARSLLVLFDQINQMAPRRSRVSDGTIGDAAHQGTVSDHNPRLISGAGGTPVVTAGDFTHDPGDGADMHKIAEALRKSKDRRIKYVIWNRRIYSGSPGPQPWVWRPYSGDNPHTHHMHVSVVGSALCDDQAKWTISEKEPDMPLTDAEISKIAQAVWARRWPAPNGVVQDAARHLANANQNSWDGLLLLRAISQRDNEERVTSLSSVLASLPPADIAAAVVEALPADKAEQVAQEVSARLSK